MNNRIQKISAWVVFAIAFIVYYLSVERTGSLWDCGEFILGAYKLEVVHPPGAPLFLLVGRIFTWIATLFSDNPEDIAFSINMMSGIATAFAAFFVAKITMMLGQLAFVGRDTELEDGQNLAVSLGGIAAGLSTAFATSIWFSAVEGEVYAMSTFFTALTVWAMVKWYSLPDEPQSDRWMIFAIYAAGLSSGVHLLSLLTFPALAILYYVKKYESPNLKGVVLASLGGIAALVFVQKVIIVGIPTLWKNMELMTVNSFGMGFDTGIWPTLLIIGGAVVGGLYLAEQRKSQLLQTIFVSIALLVISYSTVGVVVIRAKAETPINMNAPSDPMRLLPYLNREQYGERPLLRGPQFNGRPYKSTVEDRYGRLGDRYEYTDYKISLDYKDKDKVLFPRMSDATPSRQRLYKQWVGLDPEKGLPGGRVSGGQNLYFFWRYQIKWMYWRYFMWNFSGRQNGEQGHFDQDISSGNWITGIDFIDQGILGLGNMDELPDRMRNDKSRNVYYALPFIFGLIGLFFHFKRRQWDALAILALFVITGIGIIVYSNQPPSEPRERDYVLAGSIFTYCIWIGMAAMAIFDMLQRNVLKGNSKGAAIAAGALVLVAPLLMGTQNFDDHTRRDHKGSRDYASNFLESCEPNSIIFTYGDNDTYPLWYAQEVEGIRTDVRVVNLSLIAVDWYINLLRRKVNDSPAIKMSIPKDAYLGKKRNQLIYYNPTGKPDQTIPLTKLLEFLGSDNELQAKSGRKLESFLPTKKAYIPVDREAAIASGALSPTDTNYVENIPIAIPGDQLIKDELAILDIISSNLWERPIYFAVTCQRNKLFGLEDYMQLEGLGLRIVPTKNKSDLQNYGIIGSGKVAKDKLYDNVMNKFRWGNFDTHEAYINPSYAPSIQTTQLAIRRAAYAYLNEGNKERAIALIDKYFESFPEMNFKYNYQTWYMLSVYLQADEYEKAQPIMRKLAAQTLDDMDYYFSLDERQRTASFQRETYLGLEVMESLMREATRRNDTELLQELESMFSDYMEESPAGRLRG